MGFQPMPFSADAPSMPRFSRTSLAIPAEDLAPALLGALLIRTLPSGEILSGRIVETEAYLGVGDRCSHAYRGRRTPRNESMYARAGTAYVYFTYGMHHGVNIVCGAQGEPVAVLIRALAPLEGLDAMRARRGLDAERALCSGPGKLCQALAIDRTLDGFDLLGAGELRLAPGEPPRRCVRTRRVGVGDGHRWALARLRWYDPDSPHVSVRAKTERPVLVKERTPP